MTNKEFNVDDLRWVRLFSPINIPKYLVEQVRDRNFEVDDFFKHQEFNCVNLNKDGMTLNPFNHLYALVDPENVVKGYLWLVIDSLSNNVFINTYSVNKEYWGRGKAVKKLSDHVKKIIEKLNLKKVFWLTRYPKHSQKNGFKRSKSVLMEYDKEEEQKGV